MIAFPVAIKKLLCAGLLVFLFSVAPATASALSAPTIPAVSPRNFAAAPVTLGDAEAAKLVKECTKTNFLGLVPWYKYMGKSLNKGVTATKRNAFDQKGGVTYVCDVKCFNLLERPSKPNQCGQTKSDVPLVLLAIIDNLLRIVGVVAVGFVFYGAIRYTASQGNPEQTAKAQSTVVNAVAGVAMASVAIAFVSYLGNTLGK